MSFFAKKTTIEESKIEKCEKKAPIWSHFAPSKSDKSKAICNHCGGVYSLGSDKPKNLTTLIPRKFAVPNSRFSLTRGFVCCYFPPNSRSQTLKFAVFEIFYAFSIL